MDDQIQNNYPLTTVTLVADFFNSGVLVSISSVIFNCASADSIFTKLGLFTNANYDTLKMDLI